MAPNLRKRRQSSANARGSDSREGELGCPVCMEPTKNEWFAFPCGHSICAECNDKMLERQYLSCPTCRTPREGVSPQQVEAANRSRAEQGNEPPQVARFAATIFFPDESGGANPFGPLTHHDPSAAVAMPTEEEPPEDDDEALAQVLQAQEVVGVRLPLTRTISVRDSVHGPMRELVDRLLSPAPLQEFLAQREIVRRAQAQSQSQSQSQPRRPLRQLV